MSVETGIDIPLDVFGGLLTEVGQSNMPSGGSPANLNVEFLPGLVRTRGGMQPYVTYTIAGGPFQIRYLRSYGQTPEQQNVLALLVAPGNNSTGLFATAAGTQSGTIYGYGAQQQWAPYANNPGFAGPLAKSSTQFGREYIAFSDGRYGYDIPRQWDGTNFDRVSQCGPGSGPSISAIINALPIVASPFGITQPPAVVNTGSGVPIRAILWSTGPSVKGTAGNIITIEYTLATSPPDANLVAGGYVYLQNFSFVGGVSPNGVYQIASVQTTDTGNGLRNSFSVVAATSQNSYTTPPTGASYQVTLATVTTTLPSPTIIAPSIASIAGASNPIWDAAWTILSVPITCVVSISNTQLAGGTATYDYTLQTDPATGFPYGPPQVGQLVTVLNSNNGGGIFNVSNATILSVSPTQFTVAINLPDVASAADTGVGTVAGTEFTFDPGSVVGFNGGNPIVGNSGGGTLNGTGSVAAGVRQCAVSFITRQGYITRPCPPVTFELSASTSAISVNNIPTGPSNVVARLLMFTSALTPPATTGAFYSIRQSSTNPAAVMQINDNTTTSWSVNFLDSDLLLGFSAEYLFGLIELGECAGSFPYAGRMFWWGELNTLQDFLNLEFCGGWALGAANGGGDLPLGWMSSMTENGAGGARLQNGGVWQDAYQITGVHHGTQIPQGLIYQTAYQNYLGNALLVGGQAYSARITAYASSPEQRVVVTISSVSAGFTSSISLANWGTTFSTQIASFSLAMPAVIPSDMLFSITCLPTAPGGSVTIDRVNPFPTNLPINYTVVRASYPSDPESFDGVTGLVQPVYSNGQAVRAVYTLRDSMYIACDRSTFVTKDVAGSEPAEWTVDSVSGTVGTVGPNGAASGEDWEVKANRYGLYLYLGKEPEKISQEIQSLWKKVGSTSQINWQYGYKIWVAVDLENKRAYVGAPINGATECNCLFVMDYNTLDTSEMIGEYPTLRFSPYTGRRVILEQGRKWTQWQFTAPGGGILPVPCGSFVEQSDGTAVFVLGGGADNNSYFIDPTNRGDDNGQGFLSFYTSHFFPTQDEEQGLQLRSHMHGFSFARMYVSGNGTLSVSLFENTLGAPTNPTNPVTQFKVNLSNPAPIDAEETIDDYKAERYALQWQTSALGEWWEVQRMTRTVEQTPTEMIRGSNMQ